MGHKKQKKTEERLRLSEEKYHRILDEMEEGYYEIDLSGNFIFVNDSTSILHGYKPEELIGKNYKSYMRPDQAKKVLKTFIKSYETGESIKLFDYYSIHKNGSARNIEISGYPMKDENGEIIAFWGITRDRTRQKQIEAKLAQAEKMEAIGTLAGGIAHDFNNILTSMIGFAELALDDAEENSQMEDNLKEVLTAGERAKELVGQILAFARQSDEKAEPVQVRKIASESLKLIRSSLPSTIEIQSEISGDGCVQANPTRLLQIIMNLCTNAAHAMEKTGGILRIELTELCLVKSEEHTALNISPGNYICLSISDTGTGIPQEIIDSIFEPYFTTKGMSEGTGMGLSVVQGIVQKYGGEITVKSTVGEGSTFEVYLPVSPEKEDAPEEKEKKVDSGYESILLVDDEPPILEMNRQVLSRLGYEVTVCSDSFTALEQFKSAPGDFDLVITDMTMPKMTGDVLTGELMKIRPDIPVILCTGYNKHIDEETASDIGIKAMIYKPLKIKKLAATIREVIDGKTK